MRYLIGTFKSMLLLCFMVAAFEGAQAQTARTFGDGNIVVRLCPKTCTAVNGHGFKSGSKTTVFETKQGWARVTAFLDRAKLVPSFGADVPQKPALWVPVSALASNVATPKPAAKKAPKKVAKKAAPTIKRPTKIILPSFRPGTKFTRDAAPAEPVVAEPTEVAAAPATPEPEVRTPQVVEESLPEGAVREADGTVVLKDRIRVEDGRPKGNTDRKAASWDEIQAMIKAQAEQAGQQTRTQRIVREAEQRVQVISAEEKQEQEQQLAIRKAAKAREAAAKKREEEARVARETAAAKLAEQKPVEQAAAPSEGVTYSAPKVEEQPVVPAPAEPQTQVAVAEPQEQTVFKSAEPDPISIGARPKTFTKALGDKRLAKLPGRKSKVRKDVVIALRHFGLSLLKSGECKGIAGGGPSTTPGMLFVTCTDNPGYLHQFPLEEVSW